MAVVYFPKIDLDKAKGVHALKELEGNISDEINYIKSFQTQTKKMMMIIITISY